MSFISELPEIRSPLEETVRCTVSDEDNNRFLADTEDPITVNVDNMEFSDYCKSKKQVTSVGHKMISISNCTAVVCSSECVGNIDSCFP
jgi:hypothetical protein